MHNSVLLKIRASIFGSGAFFFFFLGSLRDRSQQRPLAQQLAESFLDEGAHQ